MVESEWAGDRLLDRDKRTLAAFGSRCRFGHERREREVRRGDDPHSRVPVGFTKGGELLEVDSFEVGFGDTGLLQQLPAAGVGDRLVGQDESAGQARSGSWVLLFGYRTTRSGQPRCSGGEVTGSDAEGGQRPEHGHSDSEGVHHVAGSTHEDERRHCGHDGRD